MSDCTNLEIRERLPEYVHGRIGALELKWVEAHVASCAECASELSLLRSVRQAYGSVPAVSTAAIVSALPRPRPARRRWASRPVLVRLAAVVSFISLGGISLATLRGFVGGGSGMSDSAVVLNRGEDSAGGRSGVADGTPAISFGGGVSDLQAEDLVALLSAVDALEAAPPADPEDFLLSGAGRGGS